MSLTKKNLLAELCISKPEKLKEKVFGLDVWIKPVSEFQRSRRLAALMGKKGEIDPAAMRKARCFTLIDHLCNEKGEAIFGEKDINDLMEVDALKLDVVNSLIEEWVASREGKFRGGSKGS